ncbi:Nn.00g084220.m01.CDS01 [Neocucurbitaria sp. VM-36]
MRDDTTPIPDPRSHPDNANLPTINQPATTLGITIAFLSIALLAISLRLWARIRVRLWGWDDAFVLLAGVSNIVGDTMVCLMPRDGMGLHLWTLENEHLMAYFRHIYTTNTAYCASSAFIKLSILFQYFRLFAETTSSTHTSQYRIARRLIWSLIVLTSLWGLTSFLLALFSCSPIAKNWNPSLAGRCIGWGTKDPDKFFAMFLGHSVSNMVLDILVLLLPVPFLGMLRLAGKSRAGLITLFILGCLVGAVAIGRIIALSVNRAGTVPVIDMSYYTPAIYIFGVLEVNIAIVAASIPIFWPIIATLAANKIFVVNEIEIHIEEASRSSFGSGHGINLADQSTWNKDDGKDASEGYTGKLSAVAKTYERVASRSKHQHKPSNASSVGRTLGLDFGHRSSQESQRCLHRTASNDVGGSKGSLTRGEQDDCDWFLEMDKEVAGGRTTTTVERTEIPFEHIRAFDNRQGS